MSGETRIRRAAREALADAVERQGPGWRNTADSIRSGSYGNVWTIAALDALERTARQPLDDGTDD